MDALPLWFWLPAAVAGWSWLVLEFRASKRYWAVRDASDPVVVTGSGRRPNRYVRACRQEVVR